MVTLKQAQELISDEINIIQYNAEPKELYDPMAYILNLGGKRIRPALTLLSCNLFTDDIKPAINSALALEILHNFTLLHDDIMDNANLRRGQLTVHAKWNNNIAILSGDAMCIKAFEYISKCEDRHIKKVFSIFSKASLQICEGQQFDMNFESRLTVSEQQYMKMIELKTSVLLAACMQIGAICGDASEENAQHLYNFGLNLGLAFQLQDDLLDVFGNESTFGKEIGKDIVSNKKTFLLIKALELAKGSQLEMLKTWIFLKDFNPQEKINAIQVIYMSLGIRDLTLKAIESHFVKALDELKKVTVSDEKKFELKNFLLDLKNRKY
jgi:geranylgeranyl diphosphate synthase type II